MAVTDEQGRRLVRAMAAQEYFWYLHQSDPDSRSYAIPLVFSIDGPLDRARFQRAVDATIAAYDIFCTAFRELDGQLFQVIDRGGPRFALELEDRAPVADGELAAEVARVEAVLGDRIDLATGATIHGRLLAFGPTHHVLCFVIAHAVFDAGSIVPLEREIFRRYRDTGEVESSPRPPQYADYAEASDRFTTTPAGEERLAWWQELFRGARPVALPFDFSAAAVHARRDAARLGIVAEPMHPMFAAEVPAALRDAITRTAAAHDVAPSAVYLATMLDLLRELGRQHDFLIETVRDPRVDHDVAKIIGPLATWTMLRCRLPPDGTFPDALAGAKRDMQDAFEHAPTPRQFTTVPPAVRGVCFNYVPAGMSYRALRVDDGVTATPLGRPPPFYKRHWQLMLLILDSSRGATLLWTGNQRLWRRETIEDIARRYVARLEQHTS